MGPSLHSIFSERWYLGTKDILWCFHFFNVINFHSKMIFQYLVSIFSERWYLGTKNILTCFQFFAVLSSEILISKWGHLYIPFSPDVGISGRNIFFGASTFLTSSIFILK